MSSRTPHLAKLATNELTRARQGAKSPIRSPMDDDAAIAAIAKAIASNAAKRRRRRTAVIAAGAIMAAAAAVLIFVKLPSLGSNSNSSTTTTNNNNVATKTPTPVPSSVSGSIHVLRGGVVLLHEGHEVAIEQRGGALAGGDRVVAAADGKASLDLSTGTHVVLDRGTDFAVTELGEVQRFMLRTGTLQADVAKLAPGQRFIVQTSDAEIEVRGTSFRIDTGSVASCAQSTTRLSVSEGTVVVRSTIRGEDRVTAGMEWPPGCTSIAAAMPASTAPSPPSPTAPTTSKVPPELLPTPKPEATAPELGVRVSSSSAAPAINPATPSSSSSLSSTDLAEQNRIYGEATAARHRGATREAIAGYERFLGRYPSSQLAESATVERMRLLAATDRVQGSTAARDYLARWPRGFARQEATEIVQRSP